MCLDFGIYRIDFPAGGDVKFLPEADEADHHSAQLDLGCNK